MMLYYLNELRKKLKEREDIKNIKSKLRQCDVKGLSSAQKHDIVHFYRNFFDNNIPTYWHEYFWSRNNVFSLKYIPTSLYHSEIVYRLNFYAFSNAYVDKCVYDTLFPDVLKPKTIVKNINGYFYDDRNSISLEEAYSRCRNIDADIVIKPSLGSMWGRGVKLINKNEDISSILKQYNKNFIIQERVRQHHVISSLNPTSLNTLRVLSYRDYNDIFILYIVIRIGRANQFVDNETAGGINADIDLETGCIASCAYGKPSEKEISQTDVGTELKNYKLPSINALKDIVKNLHLRLPYFNLIGWDFAINTEGSPVLIEFNRCPDLSQTAHGPAFGEMTEEIFKRIKSEKNTIYSHAII